MLDRLALLFLSKTETDFLVVSCENKLTAMRTTMTWTFLHSDQHLLLYRLYDYDLCKESYVQTVWLTGPFE